ncbi:hypothetical protein L1987_74489 [Smallanthus sonchifolius]|uniref:Uncharacterized protein n=1 Tax=Smallanthus sonchifolius TaxID=185202 RepID=A0ACB9A380_9ASTR|nr:hypothetical protein L1987_74489 [Smallanthus sonchifolius]
MNATSNESCLSAFLVADYKYVDALFPGQVFVGDSSYIPMVLQWTLPENYSCNYNLSKVKLQIGQHDYVFTGKCSCRSELEEGNPYLPGECEEARLALPTSMPRRCPHLRFLKRLAF